MTWTQKAVERSQRAPSIDDLLQYMAKGSLTDRDLRVLDTIYKAGGVMMTHQVADIVFHTLKPGRSRLVKTRERLRRLFEYHLLGRMWPGIESDGLGQLSLAHFLGPSSTTVLSYRLDIPVHRVKRTREVASRLLNSSKLRHDLLAVDVWVAFAKAGRRVGWEVAWQGPREAYARIADEKGQTQKAYAPDGLVIVSRNDDVVPFFIEVDTGSESRVRFTKGKVPGLAAVYKTRKLQRRYSRFPPVLIVCTSRRRADSLVEYLGDYVSKDAPVSLLVASMAEVKGGVETVEWRDSKGGTKLIGSI